MYSDAFIYAFAQGLIARDIMLGEADFYEQMCPEATIDLVNAINNVRVDDDFTPLPTDILIAYGIKPWMDYTTQMAIFIDGGLTIDRDVQLIPWVSVTSRGWDLMKQHPRLAPIVSVSQQYRWYRLKMQLEREDPNYLSRKIMRLENERRLLVIRQMAMAPQLTRDTVAAIEEQMQLFNELGDDQREQADQILFAVSLVAGQ